MMLALPAAACRAARRAGRRRTTAGRRERAVLILEPFGMGDVLSHEPLVRTLAGAAFEVRVCARAEWQGLLPAAEVWVPAQWPWCGYEPARKYGPAAYVSRACRASFAALRRAARGAVGVDTRGDIRSVLLLHLAGCRDVVSLGSYLGSDLELPRLAARRVPFEAGLRRWELNLRFLPALGVDAPAHAPAGPPLVRADAGAGAAPTRIGLIPVAPWAGKHWTAGKWAALIEALRARGQDPMGLHGPGQAEAAQAQLGAGAARVECRSLEDWQRELRRCSLAVAVDTGPMHLADAMGVPVVALFGQGLLPLWAPSGSRTVVLSHQDDPDFAVCHPTPANAPLGRRFMDRITVGEVLAAVERVRRGR
ncbi:MAG: glycosyltransferase family 9 protein [Verrucomicrobia bacterium]|nr:glycosyltransferase family 9 protein [Verrucomicrobiota bacterium]